jgi:two-component system phosphate regulon sensor histidine kinase PhoR
MNSIGRKTLAALLAVAIPPAVVTYFYSDGGAAALALTAALPGVIVILALADLFARRLRRLEDFVDAVSTGDASPHPVTRSDDELGSLSHSLTELAPQVEEMRDTLRAETVRREAMLMQLTEGVVAVDAKLHVTVCNPALENAVGVVCTPGQPLIKAVRVPGLVEALKEVIDSGTTVRKRLKLSLRDERSFDVYVGPLPGKGSARGAMAIVRDVTPAERLDQIRRDFISNVSHEFRTPLSTIRGYAETLLDGGLDDHANRRRFVEAIYSNTMRLSNIAADLLTLSEIEGGSPATDSAPVPMGDVVMWAVGSMSSVASLAKVDVKTDEITDCWVLGRRTWLEQVVVNLLDNAIKFNKPSGEVHVALRTPSADMIELSVADTGIGIPPNSVSRIFERFYRVDKARSREMGGTGLGLSIVKHAVEQLNGSVEVESRIGYGSRFTVRLARLAHQS